MRSLLVVALAVALALPAQANPPDPLADAVRLKIEGLATTGVGLAATALGLSLLIASAAIPSCAFALGAPEEGRCGPGNYYSDPQLMRNTGTAQGLFLSGAVLGGIGFGLLAIGIPVWSVGAHREKNLRRIALTPTGVALTF
jgi:hypothetical protein